MPRRGIRSRLDPFFLIRALARESLRSRVTGVAAEVAFFSILGVFPALLLLAASLSWLGAVVGEDASLGTQALVLEFLQGVLTEKGQRVVDAARDLFARPRGGLMTTAALMALWTFSRAFGSLVAALNVVYAVKENRSWLRQEVLAVGLALGTLLTLSMTLMAVVVGPFLGPARDLAETLGLAEAVRVFWGWLRGPFLFLFLVFWATTVFHLGPARRTPWREDLPGAVLAAALALLATVGVRLYVNAAAAANEFLGLLGGGLILLLWLYGVSVALLVGACLNHVLWERPRRGVGSTWREA